MSNDDLKSAAAAAQYLANTVAAIRALPDEHARALAVELNEVFPEYRARIRKVDRELKLIRDSAARFGDVVAATAHEAAVQMVLFLNREKFGVELVGRTPIAEWPDVEEVLAEIELEYARAVDRRERTELPVKKPKEDLREEVLAALTEQQRKIVEHIWDKPSGASFTAIAGIQGAFRNGTTDHDSAIKDKVKDANKRLQEAALPVSLSIDGKRLKLLRPPG